MRVSERSRSLKYNLGMKFPWVRSVLRRFGNRTFIKTDSQNRTLFVYIKGPDEAVSPAAVLLIQRGWREEI